MEFFTFFVTIALIAAVILFISEKYKNYIHRKNHEAWKSSWNNYNQTHNTQTSTDSNPNTFQNDYSFNYDYSYMPYKKAKLFTNTEYAFFVILIREALKRKLLVCPKVRLEDVASVTDYKRREKFRGYVKSRHIDFVLINAHGETIAAIELDDPSHESSKARKTDTFKNELFKKIGVPLIRIQTGTDYITQINVAFDNYRLTAEPIQKNQTDEQN